MIEVTEIKDARILSKLCAAPEERVFKVCEDGSETGYCRFVLQDQCVVLLELLEKDGDFTLADAAVRAAVASCRDKADSVRCGLGGMLTQYRDLAGIYSEEGIASVKAVLTGICG